MLLAVAIGAVALVGLVASTVPRSETAAAPLVSPTVEETEPDSEEVAGVQTEAAPMPEIPGFDFRPDGTDERGWRLYRARIKSGGSPNLIAIEKLTPIFQVDGQDAPTYVANAFFSENPNRRPNTIQPGDEFTLAVPPDAFVVRSQEDMVEHLGGTARVRVYTSEQGDLLRYYLTDPFPIVYELQPVNTGRASIVLHRELAYQITSGRTDASRLAQLIYRIPDPDIYQMEATRALIAKALAGEPLPLEVDRTRHYIDPVRERPRRSPSPSAPT
jgi:hypothetical protein